MHETLVPTLRPPHANHIAGEWRPSASGNTYERYNPWRPSELVGEFPASTAQDADAAVVAADAAFRPWSRMPAAERCGFMTRAADAVERRLEDIAQDMTLETGKPLRESRSEVARVAQILRYVAGEAWRPTGEVFEQSSGGGSIYTLRAPIGVVALITPWNFPALIPIWKAAPALSYGNTVVVKPGEQSPLTCLHLAAAFDEAGLPAGVFNVLLGDGPEAGAPLVSHPLVRAVSFTGSVAAGHRIRDEATRRGKRVQLELGGHNPLIVLADGDLERAVEAAFAGAFWSAGQKCMSTRRIFVQDPIYDEFKQRLLERIERAAVGDPMDPDTEVGPLVSEEQLQVALDAVKRSGEDGGILLAGGERSDEAGYLMAPTLFEGLADDAYISCEEVFGPISSLHRFAELTEAIERANSVVFGLSAAIFTRDTHAVRAFLEGVEAGVLRVNSPTVGADLHVPFGGSKASGYGPREQGRAALEFYTETVTVYENC